MEDPNESTAQQIPPAARHEVAEGMAAIVPPAGPQQIQSDVESVLAQLDGLDSSSDGGGYNGGTDDDEEECDRYERVVSFCFPEEIQNEFNIRYIDVPVRKLLAWAAAELPDDAEIINEIRDEFYGGDQPEDYEFGVPECNFNNPPPTIEELSIKRVARAAGRKERYARRLAFELEEAEQTIRNCQWHIDQLEGRSSPLDRHVEATKKDRAEFGQMYRELRDAWDAFVTEREQRNDPAFNTNTRAKLIAWELKIDRAFEARRSVRDAAFEAMKAEGASSTASRSAA